MTDVDILGRKRSITRDDTYPSEGPGVLHVFFGPADWSYGNSFVPNTGLPAQSPYPWARDALLQSSPLIDPMWGIAIKKAISKQVALGWQVEDSKDIATRTRRAQELIEYFDGDFESGLQKHLRDFLTCDNGAWVEIARATRGGASRVEGIYVLDSLRVQRTRDPNIPAWYQTMKAGWKPLPADFVHCFTDNPSPRVEMAGVGLCGASVAWPTVVDMAAVQTYFREKVTGNNQKAIYLISGVTGKQLKDGLSSADAELLSKGVLVYKGCILIPGFDSETPPQVARIDLASIPDNFTIKELWERADQIYAHAAGVFIGDLRPLTGQGLGNGQQARILEESAEAMGLAAWRKQWQSFTKRILANTTTFSWSTNDLADQKSKAEVQGLQIKNVADMKEAGFIDTRIGQQLLLDYKVLPQELAPPDVTPGGILTDEQQASDTDARPVLIAEPPPAPAPGASAQRLAEWNGTTWAALDVQVLGTKASGHTGVMIALYPDTRAARQLSSLEGVTEPTEDLHLTLAFLGDSTETALASNKARLIAAIKQWAREHGSPLKGTINGVGRFFNTESDNTNAVYVSPDVPGLPELRQSLVRAVEAAGIDYAQNHGFTPHITVAYVPLDAPTPDIRPDVPVVFQQVTLAWGDEQMQFPLGLGASAKASDPLYANEPADPALVWQRRAAKLMEQQAEEAQRIARRVVARS
jgi:2'-5' RNA ligase